VVSYVAKWFINIQEKSFFILELPMYRSPRWKTVVQTMVDKARIFVVDAGKVIMIISLIWWALRSFGPKEEMQQATAQDEQALMMPCADTTELTYAYDNAKLEKSFIGHFGKAIEPAIAPLAYDWKI